MSPIYLDSEVCPFCYSYSHVDVRDCPNIDPEQLIEAVHPEEPCEFDRDGVCRRCRVNREDLL